ncbi:hypothetical protein GGR51DRAFT_566660 [Nemania sp. FL0031]|nr:hypothetical protein GGR51DRAFT_566660 [Nemania sp. FL0031]
MARVLAICHVIAGLFGIAFLYDKFTYNTPTRLGADDAPQARFELVPASNYNAPVPARGIDIIFVHGLGSNPDTTWRARRCTTKLETSAVPKASEAPEHACQDVNWVIDFLPDDLRFDEVRQDIRLFFYNYDAYWKRDALPERLSTLGAALVGRIESGIRATNAERGRDLIFVAHSYGGLVVKKALVLARLDSSKSYITEVTKGILFLGTPHRGTTFSSWGWWQAQALRLRGSNPSILTDLEYDSTSLRDLHDEFARGNGGNIAVYNFFEQRPIRLAQLWFFKWEKFCVPESSATYGSPMTYNFGLSVDHYGLNKFASRDANYQFVLSKLRAVVFSLAASAKRTYAVPLKTVASYTQREGLWSELQNKIRISHANAPVPYAVAISGLGGVGKSQLALKYAETYKDRYDPILWIDASSTELLRSSFQRLAVELGLLETLGTKQASALMDDSAIRLVLKWLYDRTEADGEWLFIVDNADDLSIGVQAVIPKGPRGTVLITSQDELSPKLLTGNCEHIKVGTMSIPESAALLLHHIGHYLDPIPENVTTDCKRVVHNLGYHPLALDLAGAYIGNNADPESALTQYLDDFTRHRDELLQMDHFQGLLPTEKTVWTVWDTTLHKIAGDNPHLQPDLLLAFLAHFPGPVIQDETIRLAALGLTQCDCVPETVREGFPAVLQGILSTDDGGWDSFQYRQARDIMLRYSLLKQVGTYWFGVTMHPLVKWRALKVIPKEEIPQWKEWFTTIILAACIQMGEQIEQGDRHGFLQDLVTHLPPTSELLPPQLSNDSTYPSISEMMMQLTLMQLFIGQGKWDEVERISRWQVQANKSKLGANHTSTLQSMVFLASALRNQGRLDDAEKLLEEIIETSNTGIEADGTIRLRSVAILALTLSGQGRYHEAEKLEIEVMETRKAKLGPEDLETLTSMSNLASTLWHQGRWVEAEKLLTEVVEKHKAKLGVHHPHTHQSMSNLASTFKKLGRWDEAEQLEREIMGMNKAKLGVSHPDTLNSMARVILILKERGRGDEAAKLYLEGLGSLVSGLQTDGLWDIGEKLMINQLGESRAKSLLACLRKHHTWILSDSNNVSRLSGKSKEIAYAKNALTKSPFSEIIPTGSLEHESCMDFVRPNIDEETMTCQWKLSRPQRLLPASGPCLQANSFSRIEG